MEFRIAEDLEDHVWYVELLEETVADVEAFLGRGTAFEQLVEALAEPDAA